MYARTRMHLNGVRFFFEHDAFSALDRGKIRIFKLSPSGREQILAVEGPGSSFAELPVFDGGNYPAAASAIEDSEVLFISRKDFQSFCREHPDVALKVISVVGSRLRRLVGIIDQALLAKIRERHGAKHHDIGEIEKLFGDVAREMTAHMQKEEQILFPYIDALERSASGDGSVEPPFFQTVVFLGLRPLRSKWLLAAVAVNLTGLGLTVAGVGSVGLWLFVVGAGTAIAALGMFEPSENEAKIRGVHSTFPFFVRMAYAWLLVAAVLGVAANRWTLRVEFGVHRVMR